MEKIPTLFVRKYENGKSIGVSNEVTKGLEWVIEGKGVATVKIDGSCCCVKEGEFYRRYDAKKGKTPPVGAIPCCKPDSITGHWPHWLKVGREDKGAMWHLAAFDNSGGHNLKDGTYEAVGPHFQGNPYGIERDILIPHGTMVLEGVERSYEGIRNYLEKENIEGIVFWLDGKPRCKIKRTDFGYKWPTENAVLLVER